MIKFNKYIKFGGQVCPPYGAKMKIDAENVEIHYYYNKTNNKVYYNMDYKTKFKGIK